jgi:hypothetical protein
VGVATTTSGLIAAVPVVELRSVSTEKYVVACGASAVVKFTLPLRWLEEIPEKVLSGPS